MILTGPARIGRDAELRFIPSGEAVINLSLAYDYGRKGGDGKRPTQWIDAGLWGKRAESLKDYLLRGVHVWVVLEDVHLEEYEGRNGKGTKLVGRVQSIEFVGSRPDGAGERAAPAPASSARRPTKAPAPAPAAGGFDDMDDDLPF